jgi:hypothetical protein
MSGIVKIASLVVAFALFANIANAKDLPAKAVEKRLEELERRLAQAEAELGRQQDVEAIRVLQYTYGYYMDKQLFKQVVDLFSEHPVSAEWGGSGVYLGRAGVIRRFGNGLDVGPKYGVLREHLQLQGVIHVAPDRKTAKGRFHALILWAMDPKDPTGQQWQMGIYENEYVRENGVWKFSKLDYKQVLTTPYSDGWGKTQLYSGCGPGTADLPTTWYHPYPENGVFPFHYPNPVTGADVPDMLDSTRYWIGNWPGEFGQCGHH